MPTEPTGSADDHVSNVLDELDSQSEVTGQPDCPDPKKVEWLNKLQAIREMMDLLENEIKGT